MHSSHNVAQYQESMKQYHSRFNNVLFQKATAGKTHIYANALIDEALAISGNPHYKMTFRIWGKDAIAFLERFSA